VCALRLFFERPLPSSSSDDEALMGVAALWRTRRLVGATLAFSANFVQLLWAPSRMANICSRGTVCLCEVIFEFEVDAGKICNSGIWEIFIK
jgi:hypothetical protein